MKWGMLGAALALAVVGVVGGVVVADVTRDRPATIEPVVPVPAVSPSYPVDPEEPYASDVAFPTLEPGLTYRRASVGTAPFSWTYVAPKGWLTQAIGDDEVKWGPVGSPLGSYGLRVKLVNERKTPTQMVDSKLSDLQGLYDDVDVLEQTANTLAVSYRSGAPENWHRYNTFRWVAGPGTAAAEFELSVSGREIDQAGMADLLEQVSASAVRTG